MRSRHQTGEKVFNYKISRGRERGNRFKSSHFISSLLEKASLIVPSKWAVFPQTHLDNSSFGSWRGVPNLTKYEEKPFCCSALNCFSNGDTSKQPFIFLTGLMSNVSGNCLIELHSALSARGDVERNSLRCVFHLAPATAVHQILQICFISMLYWY